VDAVITTLIGAAPQLGGAGVLLLIITLLLRRESQDRADYRAELTRVNAAHDEELVELRAEIDRLRARLVDMESALDEERRQRRAAEDNPMGRHRHQEWS
jgi:Skp family chaperone for outer membrane proteins